MKESEARELIVEMARSMWQLTARLYLLLHGQPTRYLTPAQVADLKRRFP